MTAVSGERLKTKSENRIFYSKLAAVGVPVLIQQVISIGLNLIDTIMVGKVSSDAIAAVGAANQVYYIFSVVLFGVFSGAAVHTVQYWGIKDLKSLRKILGIDYFMCLVIAVPTIIIAFFAAPEIIGLFSDETPIIILGTKYIKIACFSYIFAGFSFVVSYNSRAIMNLKVPTIINALAIGINTFLNYCLIYGNFGMPKLGVEGAAIATLTARIIECGLMLISIYVRKEHPLKASFQELISFSKNMFENIMKTAVPVIITEGLWALSVALIFAAYGKISGAALAIVQIANTATEFFQTVYFGVGNASAVIIGEALGQGKKHLAYRYSRKTMTITWILNFLMTTAIILVRKPIAMIYEFDPYTTDLLMKALLVFAIIMTPKMLAYMLICGVMRAGGDTVFCMKVDVLFNMGMQVPLAYIGVLALNLPLHWAIAFVAIGDFLKIFFCYRRYLSKKWMNVFTDVEESTGAEEEK